MLLCSIVTLGKILLAALPISRGCTCAVGNGSKLRARLFSVHEVLTRLGHLCVRLSLLLAVCATLIPWLASPSLGPFSLTTRGVRPSRGDWHITRVVDLLSHTLLRGFHARSRVLRHCLLMSWRSLSRSSSAIRLTWLKAIIDYESRLVYVKMG